MSFAIDKQRRVTGWRTVMTVTCGGYPDPITHETGPYDFPRKVKIPKSGRIDTTYRGAGFSVRLRATFDGKVVRDDYFSYSGPRRCRGTVLWTARHGR